MYWKKIFQNMLTLVIQIPPIYIALGYVIHVAAISVAKLDLDVIPFRYYLFFIGACMSFTWVFVRSRRKKYLVKEIMIDYNHVDTSIYSAGAA